MNEPPPAFQEIGGAAVHEMSIVRALIDQVGAEIEKPARRGRVVGLDLVVGRLSGVHVDSIRFAFEVLSPGSIVQGAELRIEERKAAMRCRVCGACGETDQLLAQCPRCGGDNVAVEGGRELLLHSIELAEELG